MLPHYETLFCGYTLDQKADQTKLIKPPTECFIALLPEISFIVHTDTCLPRARKHNELCTEQSLFIWSSRKHPVNGLITQEPPHCSNQDIMTRYTDHLEVLSGAYRMTISPQLCFIFCKIFKRACPHAWYPFSFHLYEIFLGNKDHSGWAAIR